MSDRADKGKLRIEINGGMGDGFLDFARNDRTGDAEFGFFDSASTPLRMTGCNDKMGEV